MDRKEFSESMKDMNSICGVNKVQIMEYKREFQLPQRFPIIAKKFNITPMPKLNMYNPKSPVVISKPLVNTNGIESLSSLSSPDIPFKKLRIISLNGNDMGEFNLEVRDKHSSNGKIFSITKSNIFKPVPKPVTFMMNPLSTQTPRRTHPRILKQRSLNIAKNRAMNTTSTRQTCIKRDKASVSSMQSIILDKNDQIISPNKKIQTSSNKISNKKIENSNIKILASGNKANLKSSLDHIVNGDSQEHLEAKHKLTVLPRNIKCVINNVDTVVKAYKVKTSTILPESNKVSSIMGNVTYKEIAESPFPIVSCKRLEFTPNNNHIQQVHCKVQKEKYTAKTSENIQVDRSFGVLNPSHMSTTTQKGICSNQESDTKAERINNSSKSQNKEMEFTGSRSNSFNTKSDVIGKIKQMKEIKAQKDIMTIVPNHNSYLPDKNVVSALEKDTNSIKSSPDNNVQLVSKLEDIADILSTDLRSNEPDKDCPEENSFQRNLSGQLDIIKKAVDSVKDEELRKQALKALADCCIGVKRHVPKRPPEELKSVHDTQIQTAVFGLLDPKCFVLINKDVENIQRLQQFTLQDALCVQDLSSQSSPIFDSAKQPSVSKNLDMLEDDSDFDIDNFMNQICEENLNTLQVKETLSATHVRYQKIIEQVKKDFELVKKYDEDGMLCIHNAVINNNIYDVQRYIMVLKQCKESVDILTEDGAVSSVIFLVFMFKGTR